MTVRIVAIRCSACNSCLQLPEDHIKVTVCTNLPGNCLIGFNCPACGMRLQPLSPEQLQVLREGGVAIRTWTHTVPAPRITHDDLLDFHLAFDMEMAALLDGAK